MIVCFAILRESDTYEPQGSMCSLAAVFVKPVTNFFSYLWRKECEVIPLGFYNTLGTFLTTVIYFPIIYFSILIRIF
jgi:hypothetical protein